MAISIIQTPQNFETVYNDIVFVVNSTNKTQCKFKYVADVYVNGVKVFRDKLFPEPYYGYAVFKINAILESYLSQTIHNDGGLFNRGDNSIISYYVKFGEEYDTSGNCDESSTLFTNLVTSNTYYSYNGVFQYEQYPDRDYTDYIIGLSSSKFLTNAPEEIDIAMNEKFYFSFLQDGTSTAQSLRVRTYDVNGATYGVYYFDNPYKVVNTTAKRFISMGVGPMNLNQETPDSVDLNPQGAIINNDVHSYKVDIISTTQSELVYNGSFTNALGGWAATYSSYGAWDSFSLSSDKAVYSGDFDSNGLTLVNTVTTLTPGITYEVNISVTNRTSPYVNNMDARVYLGSAFSPVMYDVGNYTFNITCAGTGVVKISCGSDGQGGSMTFDNLSIQIAGDDIASETRTFNVNRCKSIHEPYRFYWLNRMGGFDQFTFDLVSTRKAQIGRKEYSRVLGTTNVSGWEWNIGDRGRTNTYIDAKDKFTVQSNWIDEVNVPWLEELYESLSVFQIPVAYNKQFWDCLFGSGGMLTLPFRTPHNFKVGDECVLVLDSQFYNTTYNGVVTVTAVSELEVTTDIPFVNISLNESGYLYKIENTSETLLPIIITSTEFEEKQTRKTKLFNYQIDFERAYDKNLQRG